MDHFLVCENSKCRFVLDRRMNGGVRNGVELIVKKCPVCGGDWSSTCSTCGQTLAVKLIDELPRIVCCERKAQTKAAAA